MGGSVLLTEGPGGGYTYCHRSLTTPFFPNTSFRDQGGSRGWIPFFSGTLTNGQSDFVIWDMRTVVGNGLDLLVDLGHDCWLDSVSVQYVTWSGYGCVLGNLSLLAKSQNETLFCFLRAARPANNSLPIAHPWVSLSHLNTRGRTLCLLFLHVCSASADAVLDWQRCDNPCLMALPAEARQTVGHYRMEFEHNESVTLDLRYEEHLTRWDCQPFEQSVLPYWADPLWQGKTREGTPVTLVLGMGQCPSGRCDRRNGTPGCSWL